VPFDSKADSKVCKAGFRELAFGLNTGMPKVSAGRPIAWIWSGWVWA